MHRWFRFCLRSRIVTLAIFFSAPELSSAAEPINPLEMPEIGSHWLRLLSPAVLELTLISTKEPEPARVEQWTFIHGEQVRLPEPSEFVVRAGDRRLSIQRVGFKRRALYAPLKKRDLRIANHLYLELAQPIPEGQIVEVRNPSGRLWPPDLKFESKSDPMRWTPVLHVNQVGYLPDQSKKAMLGFYLGSLGELKIAQALSNAPAFRLVERDSKKVVHEGTLKRRRDVGFTFPCYQEVWEADFSDFKRSGEYQIHVAGLGVSYPFRISAGIAAAFARTYALGLYHQRCGAANSLPFTRFPHDVCHAAPAEVPLPPQKYSATQALIHKMVSESGVDSKALARPIKDATSALYPYVNRGKIDVSGGHHDAGDYSKYTINSAGLIHHLVFAADAFPGAGDLDNLGIPESGDGKSDLLQEAKWEADFLSKMQDADGGFYFLVYPRERPYEDDVLPDRGDPQVVFPKTTSATAAAVAALAQTSSSPLFRRQFPESARRYLDQAKKGWAFLERAIAKYGWEGSYQKISHYGHEFRHEDELAWAAVELFLATGDRQYEKRVLERFEPSDRETKRWTWWRLFEAYGCAIRSYAFAASTGRVKADLLNSGFLEKCRAEIAAAGEDQLRFARESAYGTSFPDPTKRFRSAGWYFSLDRTFDLAVASAMRPVHGSARPEEFIEAILSNLNYESGCNPVNISYLTGLGLNRQRDIVHQYAQNDRRHFPPSGLPIGNIQAGFQFLHHYGKELGTITFPPDGEEKNPYPFYDRWGDSFNTSTEFVVVNQARGLGCLAFLMAQTPLRTQSWRSAQGQISGLSDRIIAGEKMTARLETNDRDLNLGEAQILWEAQGQAPRFGTTFQLKFEKPGLGWIEAEALFPDGRRVFAAREFEVIAQPR